MTTALKNDPVKAYGFGLTTVLFWSTVATAFKLSLQHIDTFQLLFYATATSVLALLVIVAASGATGRLITEAKAHWRITLIAGAINPSLYYLVLFNAYDRLPAQVAQPINYTWAIVLAVMSAVVLGQKIRALDYIAGVICYGGVIVIATGGDLTGFSNVDLTGLALAIVSTFIWASYWILVIRDARDPVTGMCLNFLVALPITGVACAVFSGFVVPVAGLGGAVWAGLFEMSIAFVFWTIALRHTDNTARVGNLIFLAPFLSLFIINRVLGEAIQPATYVGLMLIIAGLLLQQRRS